MPGAFQTACTRPKKRPVRPAMCGPTGHLNPPRRVRWCTHSLPKHRDFNKIAIRYRVPISTVMNRYMPEATAPSAQRRLQQRQAARARRVSDRDRSALRPGGSVGASGRFTNFVRRFANTLAYSRANPAGAPLQIPTAARVGQASLAPQSPVAACGAGHVRPAPPRSTPP